MFEDPDGAGRTLRRVRDLTGIDPGAWLEKALRGNAAPDRALINLERWLSATSSPHLHLQQLVGLPSLGKLILALMGASQPVADSLIQNPELASTVLEPGELGRLPTKDAVLSEGRRLLESSTSYTHSLDRLRFLRQRWTLPIVINDLAGHWRQETVWRALSDLADAVVELASELVWKGIAAAKDLPEQCPVMVVAFGKLGGRELNYSSDIDLTYVLEDSADERLEKECTRFCEALGRALSDRMGRGSLYRVDLRLRPYGGTGPILRRMRAYESYYNLYAEQWELQALLRTRSLVGSDELAGRWEKLWRAHCFKPNLTEVAIEEMVAMRARIEQHADPSDIKRGTGGIRDVEFLTQVLQLVHGSSRPALQIRPTCDALRALDAEQLLEHTVAQCLVQGYTFLRRLEHRVQLVGDQQTHSVPEDARAREALAKMMDFGSWRELSSALEVHRRTIGTLYRSTLNLEPAGQEDRDHVIQQLGPLASAALQWFDVFPVADAFYDGLNHNEGSLERVRAVLSEAPALVPFFKSSLALTELLMSGEIEEPLDPAARFDALTVDSSLQNVTEAYMSGYTTVLAQWVLEPDDELGARLSALGDRLVRYLTGRLCSTFSVLALGSYGCGDMCPGSDLDLLLLVESSERHGAAEAEAQDFLALMGRLKRYGAPVSVDLRLRPEGGKGLLVRTLEGLKAYDFSGMEMWERFALGHARLVVGSEEAREAVLHSAYGLPLTPERLKELMRMKRRIETERVLPHHVKRQVKLGAGGLNDIEWLVHLTEMRYPTATKAGEKIGIEERIRSLGRAGLLNMIEVGALLEAHSHLHAVRTRLHLMGMAEDLVPENPDKLDRLARAFGDPEGNAFLARHTAITDAVRRLYVESLERLKA